MRSQRSRSACSFGLALMAACLWLTGAVLAQSLGQTTSSSSTDSSSPSGEGKKIGDFQVIQSVDIGGRISDVTGSQPMYNTLENYQSGARLLDQSLIMQSLTHEDIFDTLTLSSFGWGGDPEQAARLRIDKYHWYSFSGSYQYMQNYFDYDLFANPLNPPTGVPFLPIENSPHGYYNRQKLYNYNLVLLPMHRLSFRIGYNHNRFEGPAFSTLHIGTEALLNETTDNTMNGYTFGADFRATKRTTISYTQTLQSYNGGTTDGLNPFNSWPLANGVPVSLGLSWFNGGSPCTKPLLSGGIANPACNGYFGYNQSQDIDTFIPTEQINIRSSSIKHLDFNGQYQYSHARMSTPFGATFSGLETRTDNLGYNTAGSYSDARWNSASADVSAVYHITDKLRLVEAFHFRNYNVEGNFFDLASYFFASAGAGTASLLSPIGMFPPTTLLHNASSYADILDEMYANLLSQNSKENDFQVQYDVTHFFGVRAGFNWNGSTIQPGNSYQGALGDIYYPNNANRGNCVGLPLNPDGSCTFIGVIAPFGNPTTEINRYTGVLGAWFRKGTTLHANIDAHYGAADNWIYRIDPMRFFDISGNINYTPSSWLNLGADLVFQHAINNNSDLAYNQHNYSTTFDATIMPNGRWGLDLAYSFDAIQQNMNICFAGTVLPPGTFTCVGDPTLNEVYNVYQTHTQYGYFAFNVKPVKRVTMRMGYSIVDNQGNTTSLNALLPLGPLSSSFQSPLAGVDFNVYKDVTFKTLWNYYQYSEGSFVGPTAPRYFHANNGLLALQYAF